MSNDEIEIWKPIEGWPYEVSSCGRVRRSEAACGTRLGHILKPVKSGSYLRVSLFRAQKQWRAAPIHVLVCTAFHGSAPTPKHWVAHWDGDELNNRPSNLRWATPKENCADRERHGHHNKGEKNGGAKLTENDIFEIKRLRKAGVLRRLVAAQFGIHPVHVTDIVKEKRWKHLS
ncbi:MAG: NUMOD4 motif-containing HNH endonuclease [Patescibacteria group bacterium]|nr:NUMOD4 motif-containing HNH endonuclease [Patescibacteria group bacterium]